MFRLLWNILTPLAPGASSAAHCCHSATAVINADALGVFAHLAHGAGTSTQAERGIGNAALPSGHVVGAPMSLCNDRNRLDVFKEHLRAALAVWWPTDACKVLYQAAADLPVLDFIPAGPLKFVDFLPGGPRFVD